MIKVKLLDNRFSVYKKMKLLEEKLENLPKAYLKELVQEVVLQSPVDTGTYMDHHNVGAVGEPVNSHGKPRNQPWQPHADKAVDRLFAQIDMLSGQTSQYYISNSAVYAEKVELEHLPYTLAKAKAQGLLEQAKGKVGL